MINFITIVVCGMPIFFAVQEEILIKVPKISSSPPG
jgi:hypothetical protein